MTDDPGWGHGGDLTLTLTLGERELLMRVLTDEIEHRAIDRSLFNALCDLRARIRGGLQAEAEAKAFE